MIRNAKYHYYVEGQCEKKLIRTLIEQRLIIPGQTDVLNPVQESVKSTHIRLLPQKTIIILVFDTDRLETGILNSNLDFLKKQPNIKNVFTVPQSKNLEDEMIRCTDIRHPKDLLGCSHDSDFKTAFIDEKRLFSKLQAHNFDFNKLWSAPVNEPFLSLNIQNQSDKIKL